MNTISIDFKPFIEWDNNPFILFDNQGKIAYLNDASEILLGYVSQKEIYDIAVAYAPQSFGSKTTVISLNYGLFTFHSITVGYEDEDYVSIRLYNAPKIKLRNDTEKNNLIKTDINTLLGANLALFQIKNKTPIHLFADQDLPKLMIDQNIFSKLLRKTLDAFKDSDSINISLKLIIGQYIIIDDKKEMIAQLRIFANTRDKDKDRHIESLASQTNTICYLGEYDVRLEIPLIKI